MMGLLPLLPQQAKTRRTRGRGQQQRRSLLLLMMTVLLLLLLPITTTVVLAQTTTTPSSSPTTITATSNNPYFNMTPPLEGFTIEQLNIILHSELQSDFGFPLNQDQSDDMWLKAKAYQYRLYSVEKVDVLSPYVICYQENADDGSTTTETGDGSTGFSSGYDRVEFMAELLENATMTTMMGDGENGTTSGSVDYYNPFVDDDDEGDGGGGGDGSNNNTTTTTMMKIKMQPLLNIPAMTCILTSAYGSAIIESSNHPMASTTTQNIIFQPLTQSMTMVRGIVDTVGLVLDGLHSQISTIGLSVHTCPGDENSGDKVTSVSLMEELTRYLSKSDSSNNNNVSVVTHESYFASVVSSKFANESDVLPLSQRMSDWSNYLTNGVDVSMPQPGCTDTLSRTEITPRGFNSFVVTIRNSTNVDDLSPKQVSVDGGSSSVPTPYNDKDCIYSIMSAFGEMPLICSIEPLYPVETKPNKRPSTPPISFNTDDTNDVLEAPASLQGFTLTEIDGVFHTELQNDFGFPLNEREADDMWLEAKAFQYKLYYDGDKSEDLSPYLICAQEYGSDGEERLLWIKTVLENSTMEVMNTTVNYYRPYEDDEEDDTATMKIKLEIIRNRADSTCIITSAYSRSLVHAATTSEEVNDYLVFQPITQSMTMRRGTVDTVQLVMEGLHAQITQVGMVLKSCPLDENDDDVGTMNNNPEDHLRDELEKYLSKATTTTTTTGDDDDYSMATQESFFARAVKSNANNSTTYPLSRRMKEWELNLKNGADETNGCSDTLARTEILSLDDGFYILKIPNTSAVVPASSKGVVSINGASGDEDHASPYDDKECVMSIVSALGQMPLICIVETLFPVAIRPPMNIANDDNSSGAGGASSSLLLLFTLGTTSVSILVSAWMMFFW